MAGRSGIAGTAARLAGVAAGSGAARLAVAAGGFAGAACPVPSPPTGGGSRFDRAIDGLNRLPRPAFALGALGLFGYGLFDPDGFARRMGAFAAVPEPLWWLLGGVVGFYFGARELHHFREGRGPADAPAAAVHAPAPAPEAEAEPAAQAVASTRPRRGAAKAAVRSA